MLIIGMISLIVLWLTLCALSFGGLGLIFVSMRNAAQRPWWMKIDKSYRPEVSMIIPTYNESSIIRFKLENLSRIRYPRDLVQIIVVDSKSEDQTIDAVNDFVKLHPETDIQVLVENERKGKSAALNLALKHCEGNIVIVSDADCFWPADILLKALPFLADPRVGAISGPKVLLNPEQSWVTKTEEAYLNSINLMRLGESKIDSTLLFEGGFSAFKKEAIESFDPYNTGSDDCGTIIKIAENNYRTLFVPEAKFFAVFPTSWREKMNMKIRRTNQLVRVFSKYAALLLGKRIKSPKRVIAQGIFLFLVGPLIFIPLLMTTILLLLSFPHFASIFLIFLIPRVGSYLFEVVQNYFVLLLSILSLALNKKFVIWDKPGDRALLTEDMLRQYRLI